MKQSYIVDLNGTEISFPISENFVVDGNGVSLTDKLYSLNTRIDNTTLPSDLPTSLYYSKDENKLYLYSGDTVLSDTTIKTAGGTSFPPGDISDILITPKNASLWIQWTDPNDTVIDGITISRWAGTKVVVKAGSLPTGVNDGVSITDVTTRNQYQSSPLEIDNLVNGVTYYVRFFPYATDGTTNVNATNYGTGIPKGSYVYGFHINPNDSNPSTAVTYLEDAVGKTPVSMNYSTGAFNWGDWSEDEFFMPRPCMLKYDMTVDYYLDPNDYSKKIDGTASDISNSSYQGNAMMEWGRDGDKIWYKVVPDSGNANGASIYISNTQADSGYKCWNFYDANNTVRDHFYTAIYNGSYISSRMRSLSGQTTGTSQSATTEISYARSNNTAGNLSGDRWYTETFGDRTLINYLLVLLGKSLDTQTVYGYGYAKNTNSGTINTGTMNTKGLFWGENTGVYGVKVFGMENWWGNVYRRIAGLMNNSSNIYVKLTPNTADGSSSSTYTTTVSGMSNTGMTSNQNISYPRYYKYFSNGYSVINDTSSGGTNSTYYCDYGYSYSSSSTQYYAYVCGDWCHGLAAGAFYCVLSISVSNSGTNLGAALSGR